MTPRRKRQIRRNACRLAGQLGLPCRCSRKDGWLGIAVEMVYRDAMRKLRMEDLIGPGGRFMGMDFGFDRDRCVKVHVKGDTVTFIRDILVTPPAKVCPLLAQFPLEIVKPTLPPGPMFT